MHLFVLYVTVGQYLLCLRNKNNLFQQIEWIKKNILSIRHIYMLEILNLVLNTILFIKVML